MEKLIEENASPSTEKATAESINFQSLSTNPAAGNPSFPRFEVAMTNLSGALHFVVV
jgi:hypothetical protein